MLADGEQKHKLVSDIHMLDQFGALHVDAIKVKELWGHTYAAHADGRLWPLAAVRLVVYSTAGNDPNRPFNFWDATLRRLRKTNT